MTDLTPYERQRLTIAEAQCKEGLGRLLTAAAALLYMLTFATFVALVVVVL